MGSQTCPVCAAPVPANPRYPRCLCRNCAARAATREGRALRFFNTSIGGGYGAVLADSGEPYDSHDCWVEGVRCRADEAYFGGIVIQADADY